MEGVLNYKMRKISQDFETISWNIIISTILILMIWVCARYQTAEWKFISWKKNDGVESMGNQKFGVFVGLFGLLALIGLCDSGDVVCSVENYILAGLEFSDCQKEALKSFKADDSKDDGKNPCRILNDVVETCAAIVQVFLTICYF